MFNIKIYEKDGTTFKLTTQIEKLESISGFSSQLSGGFSDISLGIAYKITDQTIGSGDIIKVQYKTREIYVGSIINIKKIFSNNKEIIVFRAVGLASLMSTIMTNATYSDIASNIVKDLIDDFNLEYGSNILSYDASSIPTTIGTLNFDFSGYKTYLDCIKEVEQTTGLSFVINKDGKVFFRDKNLFNSHNLTIGKDVDELLIEEDSKELVNSLILKYSSGTSTYSDATSISTYGKKEKYIDKASSISNLATANIYGASYLEQYKQEFKKISIILNNEYNFFDIVAGDLINVRNTGYAIDNLQVAKITYGIDTANIELEKAYSFAKEIFNS